MQASVNLPNIASIIPLFGKKPLVKQLSTQSMLNEKNERKEVVKEILIPVGSLPLVQH